MRGVFGSSDLSFKYEGDNLFCYAVVGELGGPLIVVLLRCLISTWICFKQN